MPQGSKQVPENGLMFVELGTSLSYLNCFPEDLNWVGSVSTLKLITSSLTSKASSVTRLMILPLWLSKIPLK